MPWADMSHTLLFELHEYTFSIQYDMSLQYHPTVQRQMNIPQAGCLVHIYQQGAETLKERGCYLYCSPAKGAVSQVHREYCLILYLGLGLPSCFAVLRWGSLAKASLQPMTVFLSLAPEC